MRIKLIDVDNRLRIRYNKVDGVYNFGDDNSYPQLIKSLIGSSRTAKNCIDINSKNIFGKGFQFEGKATIVNKNGLTLNQLLRLASKEFAEQNNLFFHVNYNALYQITSVNLLPSTDVRIGKSDSTGYSGKYVIYDNWDKSKAKKIDKKDFTLIDKFNPSPAIIDAQVESVGGWSRYKGQILHITADFSELYSLSDGDSVLLDMDNQYQASLFKNTGLRRGYFGSKLFITKPFNDDYERNDFEQTIQNMQGAENSSGVLLLEANNVSDNLDDQFKITDIDSNIDDKIFAHTEESSVDAILEAFGVPAILVNRKDNSIFGNSGELLKQAKITHWENKEEERSIITEAFQTIFSRWHEQINPQNDWTITPIITQDINTPANGTNN